MKGYTSSLGESTGNWVGKDGGSHRVETFSGRHDSGTSFLMGSAPSNLQNSNRTKPFEFRDPDYVGNYSHDRRTGTGGCFGAGSGGKDEGVKGHQAIVGIFLIGVTFFLVFVAITGGVTQRNAAQRGSPQKKIQMQKPIKPSAPLWY